MQKDYSSCRRLLSTVIVFFFLQVNGGAQVADIILTNGKIFTSDSRQLYVEALAIKGNKILAVGTTGAISKLATPKTKRIDLQGKTVVPGLNQAHDHLGFPVAPFYTYTEYGLAGLSKEAVVDSIARLVTIAKPNQWITGPIGAVVLFDTSMRAILDSIAPNNPVMVYAWWGHGQVINQKALEAAGLSDSDKDPVGGWYIRTDAGKIISIMENAQIPVWTTYFGSDYDGQIKGLRSYAEDQLRRGFTTVQQMSSLYNLEQSMRFFADAKLPQRIRIIAWPHSTFSGRKVQEWNVNTNLLTPLVSISGIKYLIDGTPIEQSSLNKQPYSPGGNWYGRLNYPLDTMRQILKEALTSDRQLMMHIVGDSSVAVVLSLMKQMAGGDVWREKRVRIEHNPLNANSTDSELSTLKDLGLFVMHTPRFNHACPLRSLIERGIVVGISPDGGATNPFMDIMIVTSRQTNPHENITREQAVIAYTRTNAFAEFKEMEKGTLAKGMLADLAVLSQDIFTIPTEQLPATHSVLTIIDGKIVYQSPENRNVGLK